MKTIHRKIVALAILFSAASAFAQLLPPGGVLCTNCPPYTINYVPPPYVPGLKLAVLPPSGTNLFINLLEADPAGTYHIFTASNLVSATWNDVLSGTNGQTNFALTLPQMDMRFFRAARTDTPVTNTSGMTIQFPNNDVNTNLISAIISGGPAAAMAVLVNDTNLADAVWIPFSAVPYVLLGTNDGTYQVWFGFRGSDGTNYWTSASVTLDTTPPLLVITNLSSLSGSRPFIDPAGYTTKSLSSLTFDVTNSLGVAYSDQGEVVGQACNPADMCHATNRFVCLDVALTLGTNHIAIHAMDWAGNVTTTNFSYIFNTNGDTTAPAIAMTWPQDGMEVSATNFTLRGTLDDDTATVSGEYMDTNGVTNTINGDVERGGRFWLENLPLNAGTNTITITATDAAGNVTTTNLTLVKSSVSLTMDTVSASQLNQVQVNVTGKISEPTYAVWVNGVQGYNNGDGTWGATNVPVTSGGTASFDMTAYPPSYAPSGGSWTNFAVEDESYPNPLPADPAQGNVSWDKQPVVYVQSLSWNFSEYIGWTDVRVDEGSVSQSWAQGQGGFAHYTGAFTNNFGSSDTNYGNITWPPDAGNVPSLPGHYDYVEFANGVLVKNYDGDSINGLPPLTHSLPINGYFEHVAGSGVYTNLSGSYNVPPTWSDSAQYVVELFTGGKASRQNKSLFVLSQSLTWAAADDYDGGQFEAQGIVPSQQIALDSQGTLGSDGNLYITLADGQNVVITPRTTQPYSFVYGNLPGEQKYTPTVTANGTALDPDTAVDGSDFCVGQKVTFDVSGLPSLTDAIAYWKLPGTFVNEQPYPTTCDLFYDKNPNLLINDLVVNGTLSTSCWYVKDLLPGTASVDLQLYFSNGQNVSINESGQFNMYRPSTTFSPIPFGTPQVVVTNGLLTLRHHQMTFRHQIDPGFFPGTAGYTQLISGSYTRSSDGNLIDIGGGTPDTELDNGEFPRGQPSISAYTNSTVAFWDAPADGLHNGNASMDVDFSTYLLFKPDGSGSIYVPLRLVSWTLNDAAANLIPSGNATITSEGDCTAFPLWTSVFINSGF